jgi:1-phosphatidylinositol phosphodiesterase
MSDWLQLFYRGGDNALWTRFRDPSGNWSDEGALGGDLTSDPVAAVVPGSDTLELFYRGGDNGLWTRWSAPGTYWSDEVEMGGVLNGAPVAAVIPGTNILQLFYRGSDNALFTRWRNQDGSWSDQVRMGGVLTTDPVAAVVPGTNTLQLFYRGGDDALWTRWLTDGTWSDEVSMNGYLNGAPVAAAIPGTNTLQLFYRGGDNALWTRWLTDGTWSDEVSMGGVLNGDPVAAVIPGTNILQVFYRGGDNALWTRWRNQDGSWSSEVSMDGYLTTDPVAAVIPGTNTLELFYRGGDNALWTRWLTDGTWSDEVSMGGVLNGAPLATAPVVAVSPLTWMSQLSDDSKLSELTLPGTHESCTAFITPIASAQAWSLQTQLQHGIRYVDIRCRHIQDIFAIHHDEVYVGFNFGEGVRDVCVNFLAANPSETIVMQIKHEYIDDPDNNLSFQEVLDNYVQGFENFFYKDNRIPTLGEVRGKIVLVRRFDLDSSDPRGLEPLPWQDDATFDAPYVASDGEKVMFHVQDRYAIPTLLPGDIGAKWSAIQALLDQASADGSDAWYINFASGSSAGAYPNAVAPQINPQLYNYVVTGGIAERLGTLMLDFPDDRLIARIIDLNT